jgi:hypothetical protein
MYTSDEEDFAGSQPSKLDTWVFDKVKVSSQIQRYSMNFLFFSKKNIYLTDIGKDDF